MSLYGPGAKCQEPGCDEPPGALGLCPAHKAANRAARLVRPKSKMGRPRKYPVGAVCGIEGCGKPMKAKGLCVAHWKKWKRYGDPLAAVNQRYPAGATCKVDGCGTRPDANWLCPKHRSRLKRHGDVHKRFGERVAC